MNFEDHDYVLSLTSHLPHAIAYNIVKQRLIIMINLKTMLFNMVVVDLRLYKNCSIGSDNVEDIFIDNSDNILKVINDFSKNLEEMKVAIQNKMQKIN